MGTGAFKGAGAAKVYENGSYLAPDGQYRLKVLKPILKKTRKSGTGFILECEVVETSNPAKDPVGAKRSWYQSMQDTDIAFPALKGFLYALLGYDYKSNKEYLVTYCDPHVETFLEEMVDASNPMAGRLIDCRTTGKITAGKKQPFTRHDFEPTPGQAPVSLPGAP